MSAISGTIGAVLGSRGAKKSADAQEDALRRVYTRGKDLLNRGYESSALNRWDPMAQYIELLEDPSAMPRRPSTEYFYGRGIEALNARASTASGGGLSGPSLMALQEYGQNFAASQLDAELERLKFGIGQKVNLAVGRTATLSGESPQAANYINQANVWSNFAQQQAQTGSNIAALIASRGAKGGGGPGGGSSFDPRWYGGG